ncbi:MAG: hypothetical protein QOD99_422 [Chthoniobacter sp.]|jgi:integrase|nr:hypothetical protein [Chthoniobacter sp.]
MITSFVKDRIREGVSPRTTNLDVIVLRAVLKSALDDGFLVTLPTAGIRPLKAIPKKRPMVTLPISEALCGAALTCSKNGEQLVDYVRFLAFSGARCNEARQIKWSDVDFKRQSLCIGAGGSSKNSRERYVDFNPELGRHLEACTAGKRPIPGGFFPVRNAGRTIAQPSLFEGPSTWRASRRGSNGSAFTSWGITSRHGR